MNENLIESIQNQLNELTNKKFTKDYIKKYLYPIFEYIITSKKEKFLIAGSQGIGKSTLLKVLEKNLQIYFKKNILSLSLDDYYLSKKQRIILSKKVHNLLLTRGVPGTHNTDLLLKNIDSFEKSRYPIKLPIFNKLKDDNSKKFRIIKSKKDILLLEGWCCGCSYIDDNYLYKNINSLEKNKDKDMSWRKFYNQKLKNEYAKIFNCFDEIIYFKPPLFSNVVNWRFKQEKMLKKINKAKTSMNKKQIIEFVQHYEKITKWMKKKLPLKSSLIISVGKDQKIKKIFRRKNVF